MEKFNIYHRRCDNRWEGRINRGKRANGRRRFQYILGHSEDEVKNKIREIRSKEAEKIVCNKTVLEIYTEWLHGIRHKVKESTLANYETKAEKHIIPFFGSINVSSLTTDTINNFIEEKKQQKLSDRYIADIMILIKSVLKYAVKAYKIVNPMDLICFPKRKTPEIQLLDEQGQYKLQAYIKENHNLGSLGTAISMCTGLRIGELSALQWGDIDLEKRFLTVRKTVQRIRNKSAARKTKLITTEPKSESSKRIIPIPECLVDFLKEFQDESDVYVISGKKKSVEPRTMQYRFSKILKNAGLPSIHFHALRHIFASNCVKLGFDVKALSELLGHSGVEITLNRYVHSSYEQKKRYMNLVKLDF